MNVTQLVQPRDRREGEFDLFWTAYPRRQKKGDALKAWQQTKVERPPIADIVAAIERAKRSEQWMEQRGKFTPLPATWLRSWGWLDEYETSDMAYCNWRGCERAATSSHEGGLCAIHVAARKRGETPV